MWVRLTMALFVVSLLMGLNYLLLEAPAYPERSIHFFYGVSAGSVFLVAAVLLLTFSFTAFAELRRASPRNPSCRKSSRVASDRLLRPA